MKFCLHVRPSNTIPVAQTSSSLMQQDIRSPFDIFSHIFYNQLSILANRVIAPRVICIDKFAPNHGPFTMLLDVLIILTIISDKAVDMSASPRQLI